jgi:hypothetical protein
MTRQAHIPCPACRYDLDGSREMRCPECGRDLAGWADHWPAMISQDIFLENRFFGLVLNMVNLLAVNTIAGIAWALVAWMVAQSRQPMRPEPWLGSFAAFTVASGVVIGWRTCRITRARFGWRKRIEWALASLACSPLAVAAWLVYR